MNRHERRRAARKGPSPAVGVVLDQAAALHKAGRLGEAEALGRQVLAREPANADALDLVGVIAAITGRSVEALGFLERAVAARPDVARYHNNLGNVLTQLGRGVEAVASFERALGPAPDDAQTHNNLGSVLRRLGRFADAERAYGRAVDLRPGYAEALSNLGNVLVDLGRSDDAIRRHQEAIAAKPDHVVAHNNLGFAQLRRGAYTPAIASFRHAVALAPTYAEAWNNLGEALREAGDAVEAIVCYRRALAGGGARAGTSSNLLLASQAVADLDPAALLAEHRRWGERIAVPIARDHTNTPDPERRLKIGYVSPDFRRHSVTYFIEPVFAAHDRTAVEVFAYAANAAEDEVTARLKIAVDHWRPVVRFSDAELAAQVRADGIDILVDLAGHTAGNRLGAFATKPAPVQVSYLGYPGTTGLAAIDARLSDPLADPAGSAADSFDRVMRLAGGFLCYRPPADAPDVGPGPDGPVFISCNNLAKMTPEVVALWARILTRLPAARLLLKAKALADQAVADAVAAKFATHGITRERLDLRGWAVARRHLDAYQEAAVALDTWPYNGTTTTCEALWMGLPVVTLAGDRHAGRVGASLLGRIGLDDMVAASPEAYVETAVALAGDRARRSHLRATLRNRMAASGLTDGRRATAEIEAAYRALWREWCVARAG